MDIANQAIVFLRVSISRQEVWVKNADEHSIYSHDVIVSLNVLLVKRFFEKFYDFFSPRNREGAKRETFESASTKLNSGRFAAGGRDKPAVAGGQPVALPVEPVGQEDSSQLVTNRETNYKIEP
jgi:hypothetical protein